MNEWKREDREGMQSAEMECMKMLAAGVLFLCVSVWVGREERPL